MSSSLPSIPIFITYHYFSEEHGYKNSKESRFDRRRILRAGRISNKSGKRGRRELVKRGKLLAELGSLIHRAGVKNYFFPFLSFIGDISTVYLSRKDRRFLAKGERTLRLARLVVNTLNWTEFKQVEPRRGDSPRIYRASTERKLTTRGC